MAYIKAISYYLPEEVVSNEHLVQEFPEWTVEKISEKIGVDERHIAYEDETAADLAVRAAEKLFEEHSIDRKTIDYLLFCTQSPDYIMPTTACVLQHRLKLSKNIGAFDYHLGCSGFMCGLSIAQGLITAGIADNVLILTAETYSKYLHPRDKGNRSIFGDGAAAALISTEGFAKIGKFVFGTDGGGAEHIIIKTGAARHPQPMNDLIFDESGNPISSDYFYMDGGEVFQFTMIRVPKLVQQLLLKNELELEDISLFVFHQANRYIMNFMRQKIGIPEEKFYYCLRNVGNTVSSTLPIALYHAQGDNLLHGPILLTAFGIGLSWGGVVIHCD